MGNLDDTEAFTCRLLCSRLDVVVLNVAYRLAPEFPFPTGVLDAFDAVLWAATRAPLREWGVDLGHGFVVGGNSGGATFAAVSAHLWRDGGLRRRLSGCLMAIAVLENDVVVDGREKRLFEREFRSKDENWDAMLLNGATTMAFWSELNRSTFPLHYTAAAVAAVVLADGDGLR